MGTQCSFCERRCPLSETEAGFCGMYTVDGQAQVGERFPNRYSSIYVSHVEAVPFYHFQPGSRTLVLGGAGCNFDCHYCSNAYLARGSPQVQLIHCLTPAQVMKMARQSGCHNIAFAVNEPTVCLPSLLALARAARAQGLPVGVLTNGFTTPEATVLMGESFSFVNVSLKAISPDFYRRFVGVSCPEVVLRNIEILRGKTHLEISTPIVQGLNDTDITEIASFIASIDPEIPWHVFRLLPEYKMTSYDRPNVEAINARLEVARQRLSYVYFGNFVGSRWVSTCCPNCGTVAIDRLNLGGCGAKVSKCCTVDGHCPACGRQLSLTKAPVAWSSREVIP